MKTGTGSAISCVYATAQPLLVAVPVPLFISPGTRCLTYEENDSQQPSQQKTAIMPTRKIVEINEDRCNGCGLCALACAESAIEIVNGKAKLVSDSYCDGLGACLGECPQGAIRIVERDAAAFDQNAVEARVGHLHGALGPAVGRSDPIVGHGQCPGTMVRILPPRELRHGRSHHDGTALLDSNGPGEAPEGVEPSALTHWPVQLQLVPPSAAFLRDADLLLVADCAAFAMAGFHRRVLRGRPLVIACPKLDDAERHVHKLAEILKTAAIRSLTVVHMEVPCCMGLVRIADAAKSLSGKEIPLRETTVSIRGELLSPRWGPTPTA